MKLIEIRTETNTNYSRRELEVEDEISEPSDNIEELKGKIKSLTDSYSNVVKVLNTLSTSMPSDP